MSNVYSLFQTEFHVNETTGCYLWDGASAKDGTPTAEFLGQKVKVRDLMIRESGNDPREYEVTLLCENPRCILLKHMEVTPKAQDPGKTVEVAYTEEDLETVRTLTNEGYRQEVIAERLNTSRSRVAKMARVLKARFEKALNNPAGTE